MSKREYFKNAGSDVLPIDGTFLTDIFDPSYQLGVIVIAFYDALGDIVTVTDGTCIASASPIQGQWQGVSSGDASIDLTLAGAEATYAMPFFNGPQIQARIVLADVVGAESAKAFLWRS